MHSGYPAVFPTANTRSAGQKQVFPKIFQMELSFIYLETLSPQDEQFSYLSIFWI